MSRKILRWYQSNALVQMRAQVLAAVKQIICMAPTGAGKTVIICELIRLAAERGSSIIFLAHRKELIEQCSERLSDNDVFHGIIKAGIPATITARVQVASVQTLVRRQFAPPDILVIDECHHARAETYRQIIDRCPNSVVIGLTATPCRTDGKGLGHIFKAIVPVTTTKALIDEGFLVPFRVWAPSSPDLSSVRIQAGDYNNKQLDGAMRKSAVYGDIISTWKEHARERTTVVFAVSVAHSLELVEAFRAEGVVAEHVDGKTPDDERGRILRDLKSGKIQVVSNCGILTEGWDCPPVSCLVIARPTASLSLHLQIVGRGLRTDPSKIDCLILDHAGNHLRHGFCTDEREWSLDGVTKRASEGGKAAAAVRVCPKCFLCLPGGSPECFACGYVFPVVRRAPETKAAPMGEITRDQVVYRTKLDPLTFYCTKLLVCDQKGYRHGWAKHQFRLVFGGLPEFDPTAIEIRKHELTWTPE